MAKAKLLDSWIPDWPSTSNHSNRSKEYKLSVVTLEQEDGQESIQHLFVLAGQVWPSGRHIVNPKWANYRPLQLLGSRGDQYIPPCLSTRLCPPQAGLTHKSHLDKTADGQANFLFWEKKIFTPDVTVQEQLATRQKEGVDCWRNGNQVTINRPKQTVVIRII